MPALYGPAAGISAALGDAQGLARLALFPYEAQMTKAQAGLAQEQLREKQAEVSALHRFSTTQGAPGESPADRLQRLAGLEFQSGAPEAGMQMLKEADTMRLHESTITKNAAETTRAKLQAAKAEADWVAQRLATFDKNAPNAPQLWRQLNLEYEQQFGTPSPYTNVPYSPALYDQLEQATLTTKDRLNLNSKRLDRQERQRHDKAMEAQAKVRASAAKERAQALKDRERRLEKGGGKPLSDPSPGAKAQAKSLIQKEFPGLSDSDATTEAYNIASDAKELQRQNPSLTSSQAITRAYLAAKARGDLQTSPAEHWYSHPTSHVNIRGVSGSSQANPLYISTPAELKGKNNVWISTPKGMYWWQGGKGYTPKEKEQMDARKRD